MDASAVFLSLEVSVKIELFGMVFYDIVKFFSLSTGMGFYFREFAHFEDCFRLFNNPRWCIRYDGFVYTGARDFRFFEDRFNLKAKRFY